MFNLINRINRLFSWIKTSDQNSENSLINVQEQLDQVVVEQNEISSDITTSFNLSSSEINNSGNPIYQSRVNSPSHMQYQPPSSLSLANSNTTSSNSNNVNNTRTSNNNINTVTTRHNRRHRRSNRRSRSSRQNSNNNNQSNSTNNANTSSIPSNNSSFSMNIFSSKQAERNILSASCAVFCIAILAVSLVEIRWFYLDGGGCNVNYLGVAHFFAPGRLEYQLEMSRVEHSKEITVYKFILPNGLVLKNCANREIMLIMRAVIAFVFLAIFSSCIGLMLDTFGCMKSSVKLIRRHGVFHILTVVFCLIINGFCFWISEKMYEQQNETRGKKGKKVDISFDVSYYLIVLASGLSILATAFTLIRRYPTDEDEQLERLLEEYTGFEEPIHLERSLPAVVQPCQTFTRDLSNHSVILNNNLNNNSTNNEISNINYALTRQLSRQNPPPPPATPPPSLHVNIANTRRISATELPPPYDPTPAIA